MEQSNNPYQYNNIQDEQKQGSKALAIVGLILSIIALIGGLCYCVAIPFGLAGLIISIIVLAARKNGKGMGIAGLIMSIVALVTSVGVIVALGPIANDITRFQADIPSIVENYQDDGSLPDYLEKYREKYPEEFDAFMEGVIEEYEKNPSAFEQ